MSFKRGTVVLATAGKEKDSLYAVVGETDGRLYISDGRKRRLNKPKIKSEKHLLSKEIILDETAFKSNHELRTALKKAFMS